MAISVDYIDVWKWINYSWTTYTIYGRMFDPNLNIPTTPRDSFNAVNTFSSVNLSWFQPWLEVCICCLRLENTWDSTDSAAITFWFEQWKNGGWYEAMEPYYYYETIEPWYQNGIRMWVWIDPDEIRPWINEYRFYVTIDGWSPTTRTFTVSWLSFDDDPHPAWWLWVEWANLCYVPPSIYSGSSDTGYKHIIKADTWYSWANVWTSKSWYIWIPNSSSDHHIYYVNEYGIVNRTAESYERSGWSNYVWSGKQWFVWLTPSTSSRPEQSWYNYLCYVDWGGYMRRMWVWEI